MAGLFTQSWYIITSLVESLPSWQANTCFKSVTLKTPEKDGKYVQS